VDRFLASALELGFAAGLRQPAEFLAQFPATALAAALADAPELRGRMLELGLGMPRGEAYRKPAVVCGLQLQHALDRGELDAAVLVQLLRPDDRVRYLDRDALWIYLRADALMRVRQEDEAGTERARRYVDLLLQRAVAEGLLEEHELAPPALAEVTVELLPRARVATILREALQRGRPPAAVAPRGRRAAVAAWEGLAASLSVLPLLQLWRLVFEPQLRRRVLAAPKRSPPPPTTAGVPYEILDDDITRLKPHRGSSRPAPPGPVPVARPGPGPTARRS
jgi:hypothetical protein